MADEGGAGKPVAVVPYEPGARGAVEGEIFNVHEDFGAGELLTLGFAHADGGHDGDAEQPAGSENPVVGVAGTKVVVVVIDIGELELFHYPYCGVGTDERGGKFGIIELDVLLAEAEAEHEGAAAFPLYGALVVGGGIGEVAMVGDVVGAEGEGVGFQAGKGHAADGAGFYALKAGSLAQAEVARVADVYKVEAEHGAVKAEVELRRLSQTARMADVEGVAQEYPSPAEVGTHLYAGFGLGGNGLCQAVLRRARKLVDLVIVGVLRHGREVVIVGRNIGGVVVVETLDETVEQTAGVFHLLPKRFLGFLGWWYWLYAIGHHVGAHTLSLRQNGVCSCNLRDVGQGHRQRSYDAGKREEAFNNRKQNVNSKRVCE